MIPSGLTSTSSNGIGAIKVSAASFENGCADNPWKERVQSTCLLPSSRMRGSSSIPDVISRMGDWSSMEGFGGDLGDGEGVVRAERDVGVDVDAGDGVEEEGEEEVSALRA